MRLLRPRFRNWQGSTSQAIKFVTLPVTHGQVPSIGGLIRAGFSEEKAGKHTEMGDALRNGSMQADFFKNKPTYGKVKLEDFAKNEFAPAFGA